MGQIKITVIVCYSTILYAVTIVQGMLPVKLLMDEDATNDLETLIDVEPVLNFDGLHVVIHQLCQVMLH